MNVNYSYTRKRAEFGRRCQFVSRGPKLVVDLKPDPVLAQDFVYKRFMHKAVQAAPVMSATEICDEKKVTQSRGMLHEEGGWPKEINPKDEEQVERYRKRTQRDDGYVTVIKKLATKMEHAVLQNNAVAIFESYFDGPGRSTCRLDAEVHIMNVYRCPNVTAQVEHISWHTGTALEVAVTTASSHSFIWNLDNPNEPLFTLSAPSQPTCLEFHPKDNRVASGLASGQVVFWDLRSGVDWKGMSASERSHRSPVTSLLWTATKTATEFFTASEDGWIKWWDYTTIKKPTEEIEIGPPLTCLEYDPNIPTRFMVATADGTVVSGNRRGGTLQEKLPWRIKVRQGPVHFLLRNPAFPKILLIAGGPTVQIWSEDCRKSGIFWTAAAQADITAAAWSPSRFSVIATARADGYLDVWDFLERRQTPVFSLCLEYNALTAVSFHDGGELVAVGTADGAMYVARLSDNLVGMSAEDKAELAATFEREVAREKVLEAKWREARMKTKNEKKNVIGEEPEEVVEGEDEAEGDGLEEIGREYLKSAQAGLDMAGQRS